MKSRNKVSRLELKWLCLSLPITRIGALYWSAPLILSPGWIGMMAADKISFWLSGNSSRACSGDSSQQKVRFFSKSLPIFSLVGPAGRMWMPFFRASLSGLSAIKSKLLASAANSVFNVSATMLDKLLRLSLFIISRMTMRVFSNRASFSSALKMKLLILFWRSRLRSRNRATCLSSRDIAPPLTWGIVSSSNRSALRLKKSKMIQSKKSKMIQLKKLKMIHHEAPKADQLGDVK